MDDRTECPKPPRLLLLAFPTGVPVECDGGSVLVGRNSDADLRLPMTDVSREHCRFVFHDGVWTLVDLNSTNGTFVNHRRIAAADLNPGDHIRIANFEFEFPQAHGPVKDLMRTTQPVVDALRRTAA